MALIAARMMLAGRAQAEGATRLKLLASAEAAADGAVYETILQLVRKDPRWAGSDKRRQFIIGRMPVDVRLKDESGKINPNAATPALLQALFVTVGIDNARAADLSRAIADWRNTKPTAEEAARGAAAYRMNGLDYAPAHEPFHFQDQLGAVIGMSPAILAAIAPHLTLYDDKGPVGAHADPIVYMAMRLANIPLDSSAGAPDHGIYTIRTSAAGPGTIVFRRRAVAEIDGSGNYTILLWDIDAER